MPVLRVSFFSFRLSVLSGAMEMIVSTLLTGREDMRDAALLLVTQSEEEARSFGSRILRYENGRFV